MDYGKNVKRNGSRCLECGCDISYGRSDRKFCSDRCKDHHHNQKTSASRNAKRRVLSMLNRNYEILDKLVKSGVDAIWISDLLATGFNPYFATSVIRRHGRDEYSCFDIHYIMTPHRISSISKIQNLSLNLQAGSEKEDQV